jgi:hypothetical protein
MLRNGHANGYENNQERWKFVRIVENAQVVKRPTLYILSFFIL